MFSNVQTPKLIEVAAGLIYNDGKILLCKRLPKKQFPLTWEIPGGKLEHLETFEVALARELKEELDIDVVVGKEIANVSFMNFDVHYFRIISYTGTPQNTGQNEDINWFRKEEIQFWLDFHYQDKIMPMDRVIAQLYFLEKGKQ